MTLMMTSSQFGLEDIEALLMGPSSPMADAVDFLSFGSDQAAEGGGGQQKGGGPVLALASSSLSSSSSPPPFYSPPPSPPASLLHSGDKSELLSLPCLDHPAQLRHMVSVESKEDMFGDLDWMAERVDLSDFDLDFLMDSCGPTKESPSSSEDLLATLDCPMELDTLPDPLPPPVSVCPKPDVFTVSKPEPAIVTVSESYLDPQDACCPDLCVPEPQGEELEIKSEPVSPDPSSPAYTLDLGSEVDVSETEVKPVVVPVMSPVVPQVPRLVFSLSPTRIVLVLAPKDQVITTTTVPSTAHVVQSSPTPKPSRSRPYPEPSTPKAGPSGREERGALKAPKAKKLKKMEQNKTAATRYRQKKRAENESLQDEFTRLERKNIELTEKAESMAREIEYLKELMDEVRSARTSKGADP